MWNSTCERSREGRILKKSYSLWLTRENPDHYFSRSPSRVFMVFLFRVEPKCNIQPLGLEQKYIVQIKLSQFYIDLFLWVLKHSHLNLSQGSYPSLWQKCLYNFNNCQQLLGIKIQSSVMRSTYNYQSSSCFCCHEGKLWFEEHILSK